MTALLWLSVLAKALATAITVIAASVAAEALGPLWGAIVVCLPVAAGPAYVFLAIEHGPHFIAASALNSAAATAVTGLFLIVFATLAARISPWRSLGAAVLAWLAASLVLQQVSWTVPSALALNAAVYGPGLLMLRRRDAVPAAPARAARRRWFELPLRAAAVAAFVSLVVAGSNVLGPAVTGIAAVFPVSLISLFVILTPRLGGPAAAQVAVSALPPMLGFVGLLLAVHLTAVPWGIWAAYGLALSVSLLWSAVLVICQVRTRRR